LIRSPTALLDRQWSNRLVWHGGEEITFQFHSAQSAACGQVIGFYPVLLSDDVFNHGRRLSSMCLEGANLIVNKEVDIQGCAGGRQTEWPPSGKGKLRCHIVEFLRLVWRHTCAQLLGTSVSAGGPEKGEGGEYGSHLMISVARATVRAESD